MSFIITEHRMAKKKKRNCSCVIRPYEVNLSRKRQSKDMEKEGRRISESRLLEPTIGRYKVLKKYLAPYASPPPNALQRLDHLKLQTLRFGTPKAPR